MNAVQQIVDDMEARIDRIQRMVKKLPFGADRDVLVVELERYRTVLGRLKQAKMNVVPLFQPRGKAE